MLPFLLLTIATASPSLQLGLNKAGAQPPPLVGSWTGDHTGGAWAGLPIPTVDCVAGAAGAMTCSGATATAGGSPLPSSTSSYFHSSGIGAEADYAIVYDGAHNFHDLGNVTGTTSANVKCFALNLASGAAGAVAGKDGGASKREWQLYAVSGGLYYYQFKSSGGSTSIFKVSVAAQVWHSVCASYEPVADGTSILRMAIDGVNVTAVTNAVGPEAVDTAKMFIGGSYGASTPGSFCSSQVSRFSFFDNVVATDAMLARASLGYWFPEASMPTASGTTETVTRNASVGCVPSAGAMMYMVPANGPCVTDKGAQVPGAYNEKLLHTRDIVTGSSATSPWATANGVVAAPTLSVVSTTDPMGLTSNVARSDFPAIAGATNYSYLSQAFTSTAAPWTGSVFVRATGADCTTYAVLTDNGAAASGAVALAATSTWQRVAIPRTFSTTTGALIIGPDGRAASGGGQPSTQSACSVYLWEAQATDTAMMVPTVQATGSTVSVPATTWTTSNPLANIAPSSWCVNTRLVNPIAWNTDINRYIFNLGTGANSAYGSLTYFGIYDATNTQRYVSWTPTGAAGSESTVSFCSESGVPVVYQNGVKDTSGSVTGAGTGIISTQPATLAIGENTGGTSQFGGYIKSRRVCKRASINGACAP